MISRPAPHRGPQIRRREATLQGVTGEAAWWISAFPGFFIMFTILAINLVGDGLRDAIDPSLEIW